MSDLKFWQSARSPERIVLSGKYCRLEPLSLKHAADLLRISTGPGQEERFRFLTIDPPTELTIHARIQEASSTDDPLTFAVVDTTTETCEGFQSLMRITPRHGVIEIGSILWGPNMARTRMATEALFIMARYVFEDLGYRRFEWKCDAQNLPSRAAAERFGFAFEGVFRQHMVIKGKNRDTAWFAMLDHQWPRLAAGFAGWLSPSNFDSMGRQLQTLRQFRQ